MPQRERDELRVALAALAEMAKEKEIYRARWLACVTPEEASRLGAGDLLGEGVSRELIAHISTDRLPARRWRVWLLPSIGDGWRRLHVYAGRRLLRVSVRA